jgi:hypothetical protein
MSQSNDAVTSAASSQPSALSPKRRLSSPGLDGIFSPSASKVVGQDKIRSILGLDFRDSSTNFAPIRHDMTPEQRTMITEIWSKAQIDGRNFGKDLEKLLPALLAEKGTLLKQLHSVAISPKLYEVQVNNERRSEFLAELIVAAADGLLTQGHTSMCTATTNAIDIPAAEFLSIACSWAVTSKAKTRSGEEFRASVDENDRAYMEQVSGKGMQSSGEATIKLNQIAARQPGPLMMSTLAGFQEMYGGQISDGNGQTWDQFSRMRRSMWGFQSVCAAYDARIPVDTAGKPIWCHNGEGEEIRIQNAKTVSPVEYVALTIDRLSREGGRSDLDSDNPRGVVVNMRWADPEPRAGKVSRHCCHTLLVVGKEVINGQTWYRIINPVGSYIKQGEDGKPHFYEKGAVLGDKSATWWKEEGNGTVMVQEEVFKNSLIHIMVDHEDKKFNGSQPLCTLGSVNGRVQDVYFARNYDTYTVKGASDKDEAKPKFLFSKFCAPGSDEYRIGLAAQSVVLALEARERREMDTPQTGQYRGSLSRMEREDEDILIGYDLLWGEVSDDKSKKNEDQFLPFGQGEVVRPTPPPPPKDPPLEAKATKTTVAV